MSTENDHGNPIANAAERWAENLADQTVDGVKSSPRDTAEDAGDPRVEPGSSISERSNSLDDTTVDEEDAKIPDRE